MKKTEKLDLTSFKNTMHSLDRALKEYKKNETNEFIRDSVIQRFEYCYDLSTKLIRRHLSLVSENPQVIHTMSFQMLIRDAYSKGLLLNSWDTWWRYRDDRNATSHAYNEANAIDIASDVTGFYEELTTLLTHLVQYHEKTEHQKT